MIQDIDPSETPAYRHHLAMVRLDDQLFYLYPTLDLGCRIAQGHHDGILTNEEHQSLEEWHYRLVFPKGKKHEHSESTHSH
jgi:hypothetical protein